MPFRPFLVLSLPRSRSFWLSQLLGVPHDPSIGFRNNDDLRAFLTRPNCGACDTGMIGILPKILGIVPDINLVTVRRPVADVYRSTMNLPIIMPQPEVLLQVFATLDVMLDMAEYGHGARRFEFDDLDERDVCDEMHQICWGNPVPDKTWARLNGTRLVVDPVAEMARVEANRDGIARVYGDGPW